VEAFEYQLRVVGPTIESDINDHKPIDAFVDLFRIHVDEPLAKEIVIISETFGWQGRRFPPVEKRLERRMVVPAEHQLVLSRACLLNVLEEIRIDSFRCRAVLAASPVGLLNVVPESRQQERQRCQSLLTVNEKPTREAGCRVTSGDVHYRSKEVAAIG